MTKITPVRISELEILDRHARAWNCLVADSVWRGSATNSMDIIQG